MEERYAAFLEALEEHGIARAAARFAVNRVTYVAETDEKAWEIMPTVINLHRGLVNILGDTERVIDGVMQYDPVEGEPSQREMFDNCLIGGPETVREKIQPYADLCIDHLCAYQHMGQSHDMVYCIPVMRQLSAEVFMRLDRMVSSDFP